MEYYSLNGIEYRAITPYDFLDSEYGIPVQLFQKKESFGVYASIPKKENDIDIERTKKTAEIIFKVAVKQYVPDIMNILSMDKILLLLSAILVKSLKKCNEIKTVRNDTALFLDQTARRYGKTPIETLFPCGGYNDLDAYLFNSFIENIAVNYENANTKRK